MTPDDRPSDRVLKLPRLKRCPFCWGPAMYEQYPKAFTARCLAGHAESPQFETGWAAAKWWNRRGKK